MRAEYKSFSKHLSVFILLIMSITICACNSDNDEPKEGDNNTGQYITAAEFDSQVKGRFWVRTKITNVKGDGTEYESLIYKYYCGDTPSDLYGFVIDSDIMHYFWHPGANYPGIHYYSLENIPYSYDAQTGILSPKQYLAYKTDYKILSVSEDELILAGIFGVLPKDFDPSLYDDINAFLEGKINPNDMDPDSYIKFYMRPATEEEEAEFWSTYEENE